MGQGGNGFAVSLKVGGLVLPSILRRGVMDLLSLLIYKIDYPPKVMDLPSFLRRGLMDLPSHLRWGVMDLPSLLRRGVMDLPPQS